MTHDELWLAALVALVLSVALGVATYVAYLVFGAWARLWRGPYGALPNDAEFLGERPS